MHGKVEQSLSCLDAFCLERLQRLQVKSSPADTVYTKKIKKIKNKKPKSIYLFCLSSVFFRELFLKYSFNNKSLGSGFSQI